MNTSGHSRHKGSVVLFGFLCLFLFAGLKEAWADCNLSQQCPGGGSISCTGPSGTCTSGSDYIMCNGSYHRCPTPCEASISCAYGGFLSCSTPNGSCEEGSRLRLLHRHRPPDV